MQNIRVTALIFLFLAGCTSPGQPLCDEQKSKEISPFRDDNQPPAGLWVVSAAQVQEANRKAEAAGEKISYSGARPFFFDGETAVLLLVPWKAFDWRTEDDYFRVKTKWHENDLYFLFPFAGWGKLGSFRNGAFEYDDGSGIIWRYEKIPLDNVPSDLSKLVKAREKHDYSITQFGGRDPNRLKKFE
jgi:hypothetical protein